MLKTKVQKIQIRKYAAVFVILQIDIYSILEIDKYELGKIQRNQQQTARWLKFHNKFPDAESIIDSAQFYFDNLPILLPYKIYSHLEEVVNLLHIIYIKYVKYGKIPDGYSQNAFDLFDEILNKYNSLKIKSDNFVKNNINKQFICKRSEIDWMKQTKKELLLKKKLKK